LIKRASKNYIQNLFFKNKNWKILDVGCGYSANEYASVISDTQDLSDFYPNKKFVKLNSNLLPFKDKEFDFVITSHVIEHVQDPEIFIKEIQRIAKKGYIEVPTTLEDNLVFENKKEHLWHINFDDDKQKLILSKKSQIFEPVLTVSSSQIFRKYFRSSLVIELYWENEINYEFKNHEIFESRSISVLNLFKKYISKKIRSLFR